jgi:steroid delta-isomerase-like uncharacterized protein
MFGVSAALHDHRKLDRAETTVTQSAEDFARAWIGFINAGDFKGLRSLYAEDIHEDLPSTQRRVEGADAMVDAYREWTQAFPDLRGTLNGAHADGPTVTVEATFAGTWSQPLQRPGALQKTPTDRPMTVNICEVMEVEDGKIVAARAYYDMLTILQQIGVIGDAEGST